MAQPLLTCMAEAVRWLFDNQRLLNVFREVGVTRWLRGAQLLEILTSRVSAEAHNCIVIPGIVSLQS